MQAAVEAALIGGRIIRRAGLRGHVPSFKGATDLVTATDRASERAILRYLGKRFPGHGFLGEEGGRRAGTSRFRWIVDPLDGTMNFAHGLPYYDVSVGLESDGEVVAGAIYDPVLNEMFAAERGCGAWRNGRRMHVSARAPLTQCLLATGFSSALMDTSQGRRPTRAVRRQFARFEEFCLRSRGVRRPGAAALDLAWVAAGVFDGFWEASLHPWDVAAGWVIVEEAGGRVTAFDGGPVDIFGGEFLASNGLIHDEMVEVAKRTR